MDCSPKGYIRTYDAFEKGCRMGFRRNDDGTKTPLTYSSRLPQKSVVLIRDPFDNLVGRMHRAVNNKSQRPANESKELISRFTNDDQGVSNWCAYLGSKYAKEELESGNEYLRKYQNVPCHAEWFRCIQWYNRAIEVTRRLHLPVYYLYYENYTLNYQETVNEFLDFLELERVRDPYEFQAGKTYASFFTPEHGRGAARMAKDMASPEVWRLLQHFFMKWLEK